jgi:serine/threonine-protein kinase
VAAAVMTALKKDPGRRFPSAAAFADALQPSGHGADRAASVVPVPALGGVTVRQGGAHSRAGAQASARSGAQASARSGAQAGAQAGVQAGVPDGAGRPAGRRRALPAAAAALAICAVAGLGAGARHALLDGTGPSSAQPGAVTAQVAVNAGLPTPRTSPSPASASMPVSASMPASASVSGRLGPIVVPDLSLSSVPRARARAIGAGLTVAAPVGVDHPGVRQGSVVRTDPPAGAKVAPGTRVTLYVADGLVTVPDLTGHQLADATDILQNQLRMRVAVTFVVSTADPGTVLGQDLHGHGVIPGRTVGLQVAVSVQGGSVPGGPVQTVTPAPAMPTAVTGPHW